MNECPNCRFEYDASDNAVCPRCKLPIHTCEVCLAEFCKKDDLEPLLCGPCERMREARLSDDGPDPMALAHDWAENGGAE